MNLHEHNIRLEAEKEGIKKNKLSTAKSLIQLGKISFEEIASCCQLPIETVQKLAEEIKNSK